MSAQRWPPQRSLWTVVLSALLPLSVQGVESSPYEWTDVSRIVAIGDVHGSYDKMLELLRGTDLVDEELSWVGGETHLVFVGDLVDRGPDDRPVLDLVKHLQQEAAAAGGQVHVLLGNHEVMNLSGDLRYVSAKGFQDFLPEENRKDRNRALQRFRNIHGPGLPMSTILPAFDEEFPPGYFGRRSAFWHDGKYGAWLLQQPAVIRINGIVFLHGGLTEQVASLGRNRSTASIAKFTRTSVASCRTVRSWCDWQARLPAMRTQCGRPEIGLRRLEAAVAQW